MIKIRELEKAVSSLPPQKFARFRAWVEKLDLGREIIKAEKQIKGGQVTPWAEIKRKHGL